MANAAIDHFIEKLATSNNPILAGLGTELQGLNMQPQPGIVTPPGQQVDKDFSVDSELAQGTETETKKNDEIDQLMTAQMPELSKDNPSTDNQTRFATQKVATYRDVILARLGKS